MFEQGSEQIGRHLAFRDFMNAQPVESGKYSDLKRKLAAEHPQDIDAYIDGKDEFIKEIDRRAARTFRFADEFMENRGK